MSSKKLWFRFIYLVNSLLFFLIAFSCARIGSPTGGPKDVDPPRILMSEPENYSTGFKGKELEITFDEYIQIKGIDKELFISPPLSEKPVTKIRNKTLVVDLNNELIENTTYTLNFGKAIADNNEGNALTNYEFVFSTGDYLDSLSITGKVMNAFNLTPPKEGTFVMLYENLNDTAPLTQIPLYISKTDKSGNFRMNNIKTGNYKIYSLTDENSNMFFDQQKETFAFIDSVIVLDPEKQH
ncbi:MAG: hypothetical protein HC906_09450 [Bacteroidales bacterium]|nr:hypothetical protein [Bacteroidales bacterium]